jgi:hypothetical protein
MTKFGVLVLAVFSTLGVTFAQTAVPAELALPFGVAAGKLVVSGEYLIFVNDATVESSFVVPRDNVQNVNVDGAVLNVALRQPIKDSSGDRSALNFRFAAPGSGDAIVKWSQARGTRPAPGAPAPGGSDRRTEGEQQFSYEVKHDHRVGSCSGRLIVTSERVNYESLSEIDHSRQWAMKDVKEVGRKGPYNLDIKPFSGNDYSFAFLGTGMDNSHYETLTKLIAAARANR